MVLISPMSARTRNVTLMNIMTYSRQISLVLISASHSPRRKIRHAKRAVWRFRFCSIVRRLFGAYVHVVDLVAAPHFALSYLRLSRRFARPWQQHTPGPRPAAR